MRIETNRRLLNLSKDAEYRLALQFQSPKAATYRLKRREMIDVTFVIPSFSIFLVWTRQSLSHRTSLRTPVFRPTVCLTENVTPGRLPQNPGA
jgi:hypothetical protein